MLIYVNLFLGDNMVVHLKAFNIKGDKFQYKFKLTNITSPAWFAFLVLYDISMLGPTLR